jgi:hypothetical protein
MFETTSFTVAQAIAAFLNSGHWLDRALPARLAWWTRELGQDPAGSLSPETIDARPPPAARRPGLCGRAHRQADIRRHLQPLSLKPRQRLQVAP